MAKRSFGSWSKSRQAIVLRGAVFSPFCFICLKRLGLLFLWGEVLITCGLPFGSANTLRDASAPSLRVMSQQHPFTKPLSDRGYRHHCVSSQSGSALLSQEVNVLSTMQRWLLATLSCSRAAQLIIHLKYEVSRVRMRLLQRRCNLLQGVLLLLPWL
jgi:hypothetical protein